MDFSWNQPSSDKLKGMTMETPICVWQHPQVEFHSTTYCPSAGLSVAPNIKSQKKIESLVRNGWTIEKNWVYKCVSVRSSWKQKWYNHPWGHVRPRSIGVALSMAPQRRYSGQAEKKLVGGAMCPSWKMMDFVNGKDDIPLLLWKINENNPAMFETTNQKGSPEG